MPVQIAADGTFAAQMQYGTEDYGPRSRFRTAWVTVTGRIAAERSLRRSTTIAARGS